jgi:hypothetical protein
MQYSWNTHFDFTKINSENEINLDQTWKTGVFPETIVDEKGDKVNTSNFSGRCFKLIEKERDYSDLEIGFRKFLGVVTLIFTLGLTKDTDLVKKLLTEKQEFKFFGVPYQTKYDSGITNVQVGEITVPVYSESQKMEKMNSKNLKYKDVEPIYSKQEQPSEKLKVEPPIKKDETQKIKNDTTINKLETKRKEIYDIIKKFEKQNDDAREEFRKEFPNESEEGLNSLTEMNNEYLKINIKQALFMGGFSYEEVDSILQPYYKEYPNLRDVAIEIQK